MESIIKSYLSIFFIALTAALGISLIGSTIAARNATIHMANYVKRIEDSNMARSVIDDCIADANATFGPSDSEGSDSLTFSSLGSGDYRYGSLDLTYHFRIPVIAVDTTHHIYADVN